MAIDFDTLQAKEYSRVAWEYLAEAREVANRIKAGEKVYSWEVSRVDTAARLALMFMRMATGRRQTAARRRAYLQQPCATP